jgi:soluble lytic murein transglycosylase
VTKGKLGKLCVFSLLLLCACGAAAAEELQSPQKSPPAAPDAKAPQPSAQSGAPAKKPSTSPAAPTRPDVAQLERLTRALREQDSAANYERLADYAQAHAQTPAGMRAALALGVRDFNRKRFPQAQRWLSQAERDSVLRQYASYWRALADRAAGQPAASLDRLERLRRDFSESVLTESVLVALAEVALELGLPTRALAALDAFAGTAANSELLWNRARARELAGEAALGAEDYLLLYTKFPLSTAADAAEVRLQVLERIPAAQGVRIGYVERMARAEALYKSGDWRKTRAEYEKIRRELSGAERERAELRIAQCRARISRDASSLASLQLSDAELEAERLYSLSQEYRSARGEEKMLAAVEEAARRFPESPWTEEALFATGNYFWVKPERARAAEFYQRASQQFPEGKNARHAHWRMAWVAFLERRAEAVARLEEHLQRFPGSGYTENALYWLGRAAERQDNIPHARTFYLKLRERFPQSYFGLLAAARLKEIGLGPTNSSDVLSLIPPPSPVPKLDADIPPEAKGNWDRARALRSIAFDASAELELKASYAATGSTRLLLEAAKSAHEAGRNMPGVALARQTFPEAEARQWEEVPVEVWRAIYPRAYSPVIEKHATRMRLDPALICGLIRQESVFQRDAVSRAGAVGLMQLLPSTARALARGERVAYSRSKLTDPEYNVRLGTVHFADVIRQFSRIEEALAAYNAGENRVRGWLAERSYDEVAEFIESIPFTETREYVQIVMRNAEIYRRLYGKRQ